VKLVLVVVVVMVVNLLLVVHPGQTRQINKSDFKNFPKIIPYHTHTWWLIQHFQSRYWLIRNDNKSETVETLFILFRFTFGCKLKIRKKFKFRFNNMINVTIRVLLSDSSVCLYHALNLTFTVLSLYSLICLALDSFLFICLLSN